MPEVTTDSKTLQIVNPKPNENSNTSPFGDIDYFKKYDRQKVEVVEEGTMYTDTWLRAEYYPGRGCYRILYVGDKGNIRSWEHNLRRPLKDPWGVFGDEKSVESIKKGKRLLAERGVTPEFPEGYGYPELQAFTKDARLLPEADIKSLIPDKYYVFIEDYEKVEGYEEKRESEISLFKFDHTITDAQNYGDVTIVRAHPKLDEVFGYRYGVNATLGGVWSMIDGEDSVITTIGFDKKTGQRVTKDWEGEKHLYELDRGEVEELLTIRPPDYNPLTGTKFTRETFSTYVALQGLQYTKWSKYENEDDEFQGDQNINRENYGRAIDTIIQRFGLEPFAEEVEHLFESHLNGLHTKLHTPNSPYKSHSDIAPLGANEMRLARQVIKDSHPLTDDMTESGHVVNAVPVFGDQDFWRHMGTKYPVLFQRFTDYLLSLPKQYATRGTYTAAIIDPVGVIKKYYPTAFQIIQERRSDFNSDTEEVIKITKTQ